jgi:RNA polymerase sigma-70 factor (ECF subfamily)
MRRRGRILEELLVVDAQAGSRKALETLVSWYHPRLLRFATRLVGPGAADDVVQEGWLGVCRGIARLDDVERFRPWVFQVVANRCRDWIRRRGRERHALERLDLEPRAIDGAACLPEDEADPRAAALRGALASLPANHRAALELFYLEELSVSDIARVLAVPPGTVKSRLFHARKSCRDALERAVARPERSPS